MKIRTYENDNSISLTDKLTGTDADDANKTKNYTFQKIKDFLIAEGLGGGTDVSTKVDKVIGKSLILDTEIARLLSMTAVFTTALKSAYDGAVSALTGKEDTSNKSTNVTADGASDSKYPSVKAVKAYVDSNTVDTTFVNEPYLATMSIAYDSAQPNFEIDITGNLDLTITGTVNGDSGLVNLYFSATEVATLNGITDLVVTGAGEMIPVYFIHDSDGLKWYQDEVGGATVDTSLFALQNGTTLYHTLPRFTPTGTITTVGINVTTVAAQFAANMVGHKLKINGVERIIATYISTSNVTVNSAFSVNYTAEPLGNWGVYAKAFQTDATGAIQMWTNTNLSIFLTTNNTNTTLAANLTGWANAWNLYTSGLVLISTGAIKNSSTTSSAGTPDIGLRRNSAGVYEVYDGVTATGLDANRRDLLVRNLISKSNIYADDATADADAALPSGSFYKITGSRAVYQKP
jgi:hypothetical protein